MEAMSMTFSFRHYVPCLRWKQGEYQALYHLSNAAKDFITPLIEIPEIGYDFEAHEQTRSLDHHMKLFVKRLKSKWEGRHCLVDLRLVSPLNRMDDLQHPIDFVFDELATQNCLAIPVTGVVRSDDYQQAIKSVTSKHGHGMCLRLSIEDAYGPGIADSIDRLLGNLNIDREFCDLVLDLGAPNFDPIEGFAKLIVATIQQIPHIYRWRSFTLMGSAFPATMAGIGMGLTIIPRSEWILYKRVVKLLENSKQRIPTFGDYAINHPDVLNGDMRLLKPSATIRYAIEDGWLIIKGKNVRDHKFHQYCDLSQMLVDSQQFRDSRYSWGDIYIDNCAAGGKTGNLSIWRAVGTNHHIEKVVSDIASYFDS